MPNSHYLHQNRKYDSLSSTQYRASAHASTHSVTRRQQHGREAAVTIHISIIKLTRGYGCTIDERIQSKTLLTRRTTRGLNTPNVLSVTALVKWHHIVREFRISHKLDDASHLSRADELTEIAKTDIVDIQR